MADLMIILALVFTVGAALTYIRKQKKRGVKCIGCPDGGCCGESCGCKKGK